jgi:hypothetical protein
MLVHYEEKVSRYPNRGTTRRVEAPYSSWHLFSPQAGSRPYPTQSRPESRGTPQWVDVAIAEAVEVSQPTVARVRKQYFEEGLEPALNRRSPNREYHHKLDAEQEARLLALACSRPPQGQARSGVCASWPTSWWTLRSWRRSPTRR